VDVDGLCPDCKRGNHEPPNWQEYTALLAETERLREALREIAPMFQGFAVGSWESRIYATISRALSPRNG
jgi:hypothetical protein